MLQYDKAELGNFLRKAREKVGLTQSEVSRHLGYSSPQFISNIERGQTVIPLTTLSKMIQLYNLEPSKVSAMLMRSQRKLLTDRLTRAA